jgi:hypothetical protein
MVRGAKFCGRFEIPILERSDRVPLDVVSFSKLNRADESQWVHFYIQDHKLERVWRHPERYLEKFRKCAGVITPDFSVARDLPLIQQGYSVYQSRAVGHFLHTNGIPIIPNVRWGDARSYEFAFDGLHCGGTVAVGSYGCTKRKEEKAYFLRGFYQLLERKKPDTVVVYGGLPKEAASECGARIVRFSSEFHLTHNNRAV